MLDGAKTSYQLGEQVTVNCTSLYSKPAATLEWFINDELVVSARVIRDGGRGQVVWWCGELRAVVSVWLGEDEVLIVR